MLMICQIHRTGLLVHDILPRKIGSEAIDSFSCSAKRLRVPLWRWLTQAVMRVPNNWNISGPVMVYAALCQRRWAVQAARNCSTVSTRLCAARRRRDAGERRSLGASSACGWPRVSVVIFTQTETSRHHRHPCRGALPRAFSNFCPLPTKKSAAKVCLTVFSPGTIRSQSDLHPNTSARA